MICVDIITTRVLIHSTNVSSRDLWWIDDTLWYPPVSKEWFVREVYILLCSYCHYKPGYSSSVSYI